MRVPVARLARAAAAALAGAALACAGGGYDPPPPVNDCTLAPALPAGQPFAVSGNVVYDLVPARYDPVSGTGGLYFGLTQQRPVREADVQVRQCGSVLATARTDLLGHYSVTFTPAAQGRISVYVLARTANPPIQVVDNIAGGAIWTVGQPILSASATLDVHATHGWTGLSYGPSRIAAPFAILDDLYTASHRLLDLPRTVPLGSVPLTVNWSPANAPCTSAAAGCIGTSYYDPGLRQIFVLGADGQDTDEFDRVVVVHEWGHYFENNFSRADSPGGSHSFGNVLDPRLAFSEGYASAFAAMLLQDRIYADTRWIAPGVQDAFGWDAETAPSFPSPTDDPRPGPFSELSVVRALWDLYDDVPPGVPEAWDTIATGLLPIYDTLVGPERTTPALTTLASFVAGLKAQPGVSAAAVDQVLAHYAIGPISDAWGTGDANLSGVYTIVPAPTASPFTTTATLNGQYRDNERPQNQYYVFTATGTRATVVASSAYDVDLYAYASGTLLASDTRSYTQSPTANIAFATAPGTVYVVVLTGYGGVPPYPTGVGAYTATVTFTN